MEEIVKSVREAESQAAKTRAEALARAAGIAAEAEERAEKLLSDCEYENTRDREAALSEAEKKAEEEYSNRLFLVRKEAEAYADEILKDTTTCVNRIVRRICGDR